MSRKAQKRVRDTMREWGLTSHITLWSLNKVAAFINPYVRGWINYYGTCYKEPLREVLNHVNALLVIWAKRKFKSFNRSRWKARKWLKAIAKRDPNLFAMWSMNVRP